MALDRYRRQHWTIWATFEIWPLCARTRRWNCTYSLKLHPALRASFPSIPSSRRQLRNASVDLAVAPLYSSMTTYTCSRRSSQPGLILNDPRDRLSVSPSQSTVYRSIGNRREFRRASRGASIDVVDHQGLRYRPSKCLLLADDSTEILTDEGPNIILIATMILMTAAARIHRIQPSPSDTWRGDSMWSTAGELQQREDAWIPSVQRDSEHVSRPLRSSVARPSVVTLSYSIRFRSVLDGSSFRLSSRARDYFIE